jgi:hypothetical protein
VVIRCRNMRLPPNLGLHVVHPPAHPSAGTLVAALTRGSSYTNDGTKQAHAWEALLDPNTETAIANLQPAQLTYTPRCVCRLPQFPCRPGRTACAKPSVYASMRHCPRTRLRHCPRTSSRRSCHRLRRLHLNRMAAAHTDRASRQGQGGVTPQHHRSLTPALSASLPSAPSPAP